MNSIKKITLGISVIAILSISDSFAQGGYFEDALRYSQYRSTGSARIMGVGGIQSSLGGDVSNIHGNPAGLGFFRRSEFSLTGSYSNWKSETNFMGQIQNESTNNVALPNLSVVMSKVKDPLETGNWRGGSFGISINRSQLFTNDFGYFSSSRGPNTLLDFYVDDYNQIGEPAVGSPAGLPLDAGLIYSDNGLFQKDTDYAVNNPFQDEQVENEGSQTQISFAYGGNFKNKWFVGGSLGVTSVNFLSTKTYNEEFLDENDLSALYYSLQENLLQNGTGVNLNLGVIYKPMDNINLGLSFKSPTWSRINEEFDADVFAEFYDLNGDLEFEEDALSDIYLTTINLRSPMKMSAGGTFFFNKNGFISADIDYVDYSSMNLSSPDISMDAENDEIRRIAASSINYRVGAEYSYNMFRIRAGAAYYGDPMKDSELDRSMMQYSGGVGVRLPNMYVDFGIIQNTYNTFYSSYPDASLTSIDNKQLTGLLTLGFNF
ncbi:MAG: long-chain fatty acid transporter [Anditalea sp.]